MRIRKLQLKNGYKRFHDLTINLGDAPARMVALVGPNGCGKSSVLDGMLFHHNAHGAIGDKGGKSHEYHSMTQTPNFSHDNVIIEFDSGVYQEVRQRKRTTGNENTMFSFRSPYRYNSNLRVTQSKAVTDIRLNNYGATAAIDLDDKMEVSYRRLNVKFNKYLKEQDCRPSEAKAKIIGDLNDSISNCINLSVSSIGDIEASQGTLYFTKPDHPSEFEFNVLSSGEKEVVDLLLDLYLRKDEFDDTIFLIDEPELHISTRIQGRLLKEIDRLIGDNCQIWITTHSIGFMREIQENFKDTCQVIHFRGDYDFASTAYTLEPISLSAATWRSLFEIALDDLSQLVCPKLLVYCEGRDQPGTNGAERGMDAKVFNTVFGETHSDTLFISSGGNTELDQRSEIAIALLSKVFPLLEILVLKDRDMASGKATSENDRKIYLDNNPQFHRVLKRWEIENYLYDKVVLQSYCSANDLTFDEKAYDSLVKDVHNQDLKSETQRIKNICGIVGSISQDNFKVTLSKHLTQDMDVYSELEACIFSRA
jgi:ABC-type cobalamin/Fe3+-siderophores transport system ATPase subunit